MLSTQALVFSDQNGKHRTDTFRGQNRFYPRYIVLPRWPPGRLHLGLGPGAKPTMRAASLAENTLVSVALTLSVLAPSASSKACVSMSLRAPCRVRGLPSTSQMRALCRACPGHQVAVSNDLLPFTAVTCSEEAQPLQGESPSEGGEDPPARPVPEVWE